MREWLVIGAIAATAYYVARSGLGNVAAFGLRYPQTAHAVANAVTAAAPMVTAVGNIFENASSLAAGYRREPGDIIKGGASSMFPATTTTAGETGMAAMFGAI